MANPRCCRLLLPVTVACAAPTSVVNWTCNTTQPWPSACTSYDMTDSYGYLPTAEQFTADKGFRWNLTNIGPFSFTGHTGDYALRGDKARTGQIGDRIIWSFGDMQCSPSVQTCGFSMGPAFYASSLASAFDPLLVNTTDTMLVQEADFVGPWDYDPVPQAPLTAWGMDTSNVVHLNSTHVVVYAWESWRTSLPEIDEGSSDKYIVHIGNTVSLVTSGTERPIATRVGPLLTGPNAPQLGLLATLRDAGYIYTYSIGGPSNLLISRVEANYDAVFDASGYSFLQYCTNGTWLPGIPPLEDTTNLGAMTANTNGKFGCDVYGSVFFNTYLQRYILLCGIYQTFVNMYFSTTPYGPWSQEYQIAYAGQEAKFVEDVLPKGSYGPMAHPEFGAGNEWVFTCGPDGGLEGWKVTFGY